MRFEEIPREATEIDAEFFDGSDISLVYEFLEKFGVQAEVEKVRLPGPGRGVSDGLQIRTIFQRNSRTITKTVPCWVAVSGLQWVEMYTSTEFERRFRKKELRG